ncbi:MAG: NAD-dependent epimerase/dehydratase family protein [Alphaproteobacteria bacterium]|nr:NAD-dependent epimerase/dehydratase family protein [Alphaproteobacteria bacterium]MBF0249719.1 NAD-dependent epimerase/dehydratase family protein [Alphaproteobacteria bacterium]
MGSYLVTGGAGFIGSHLARSLLADGHEVVVADNLSTGLVSNIPEGAQFVECDLARPDSMGLLPDAAFDGVIHLAAQSSGYIGQKDPYADMQANVGSTMLLGQWCLKKGVKRFLYASSMTVYGRQAAAPLDEEAPCIPISHYGVSKLASENYLRVMAGDGLSPTSLRLYNVYGPGQNLGNIYQGMVSIYLAYLLRGELLPVTGSFARYRDFVYIADVVSAFRAVLDMDTTPSLAYNVGTGIKTTVEGVIVALMRGLQLPSDYPVEEQSGTASDLFGSVADTSRISRELGWRWETGLDDGLAQMIAWAKQQMGVHPN